LTCRIWEQQPKEDIEVETVKKILGSKKVDKHTVFGLTGGEFILHPRYKEILSLFRGQPYTLFSNGILADKLIETVREFKVKELSISLDGVPDTQKKARGIDNYADIERIVNELKGDDVNIGIGYTINPWNTRGDLKHVLKFCEEHELGFQAGYYNNREYYGAEEADDQLYEVQDLVAQPYHKLYHLWASHEVYLPCLSIFVDLIVLPNGDLNLCEVKDIKLGNLYEQSLEEILTSKKVADLRRGYINCNDCWAVCHRPLDVAIVSLSKSFIPPFLLKRFLNTQGWDRVPRIWSYLR